MTPATTITGARRRAPPATTREAGQRLGHFRLLERIGQGGMGTVFAAYDERLKRKVALKLIRGQPDIVRRERMLREAQAMATLSHPNVVTVYEADEIDEQLYLAMELIDGQSLRQWAKGRPWREVLTAYIQAGRGLAAAHAVGLVHRDFKPDNVMVATGPDGSVQSRVLDFGLARRAVGTPTPAVPMLPADASPGSMAEPAATPSDDDPSLELTSTGEQVGTPAYMAPEQLLGHPTTPRSDQFSFCIALFEAIHGHRPFPHVHGDALSRAVLSGVLRPAPSTSRVPRWVHAPIERGLAQDPDHRHPSMDALLTALQRDPTRARRVGMGAGVLAVVLTAGAGGQRLIHTRAMQRCEDEAAAISETWGTGDTTALA
ncbi:MAG: serine/threonine protein kinase, partial [Deltaproteobacteria bacterium]|nr:serine/threonine protein kinase [Deltaproteobacteria bacterium]